MMYSGAEILLARKIARENKEKEQQEKVDRAKEKERAWQRRRTSCSASRLTC